MKVSRKIFSVYTVICLVLMTFLTACEEETVPKTRFGKVDPLQEGAVIISSTGDGYSSDEEDNTDSTTDTAVKTSVKLDIEEPSENIVKMAELCDAINMACVDLLKAYTDKDPEFMWNCIYLYAVSYYDRVPGFVQLGGTIDGDPDTTVDVMYAMFGKMRQMPQMPETVRTSDDEGPYMEISNNLEYRFRVSDRGTSAMELRDATQYSDGTMEMEVALVDSESGDETVSFIYTMRSNTRDTTSSALFEYEITGARPADSLTSDKMNGIPFAGILRQEYGYDLYDEGDEKYGQVDEILYFRSFQEHVPGMEDLNSRITREVTEYADQPDSRETWHRICSYPVTTEECVQIATVIESFRDDGNTAVSIFTYNYDKSKRRTMNMYDALSLCDITTSSALEAKVRSLAEDYVAQAVVQAVAYEGFVARADGSADVFYRLYVNKENTGREEMLVAFNSTTGALREITGEEEVIPAGECDRLKPVLTHGRKEEMADVR